MTKLACMFVAKAVCIFIIFIILPAGNVPSRAARLTLPRTRTYPFFLGLSGAVDR